VDPIIIPLDTKPVNLMHGRRYCVDTPAQLARYVVGGSAACTCSDEVRPEMGTFCSKCSKRCDVKVYDAHGTPQEIELSAREVVRELLLRPDTLPPHLAPTSDLHTEAAKKTKNDAHGVSTEEYFMIYASQSKGLLSIFRFCFRWNCSFAGCPSRMYVGEPWDMKDLGYHLVLVESGVPHFHPCAPCADHEEAPCLTCARGCHAAPPAAPLPHPDIPTIIPSSREVKAGQGLTPFELNLSCFVCTIL